MSEVTSLDTKQSPWCLLLLGGILNIIVGILLLTIPGKSVLAFVWVLGIHWLISGIFALVGMFVDHSARGWKLFMGILSILASIVVMRHPIVSALAIPRMLVPLLGIQGIIVGIIGVVMAFKGGGWGRPSWASSASSSGSTWSRTMPPWAQYLSSTGWWPSLRS